MMRPAGDGRALFAHLKDVEKQTGRKPASLAAAEEELPTAVAYLEQWFHELNLGRPNNGMSMGRIGYADINAWASLTGRQPTPQEVECILMIDALYVTVVTSKEDPEEESDG